MISKSEKNIPSEFELMNYETLSKYLNRSENTLRQDVQYRRIPYLKIGRLVRFRKQDIDNWLAIKVKSVVSL